MGIFPSGIAHEAPCLSSDREDDENEVNSSETGVQRSSAIGVSSPSTKLIEVRPGKLIVEMLERSEHE